VSCSSAGKRNKKQLRAVRCSHKSMHRVSKTSIFGILLLHLGMSGLWSFQEVHPVSGRRIAPVMGYTGAGWLERHERIQEENPELALKLLDIRPGMVIADLGAGSGYYTRRLAQRTGPKGKVYAVDIQQPMLDLLARSVHRAGLKNVVPVLGEPDDPKLPTAAFDLILMVDVYHELSQPQAVLKRVREALKPDGRLVLLEFRKEDPKVPIREEHKMSIAEAKQELEAEGFALREVLHDLPWQHILIFQRKPA
jgi:SAM-dependent methyltransferase